MGAIAEPGTGLYHGVKRIRTYRRSDRAARSRVWIRTGLQRSATAVCIVCLLCSPQPCEFSCHSLADTLGGWSFATATVIQDGQQSSITYNNINNVYGIPSDRASYAPGCTAKNVSTSGSVSHRVNNYINKACFTGSGSDW